MKHPAAAIAVLCELLFAAAAYGAPDRECAGGALRRAVLHSRNEVSFLRAEPRATSRSVAAVRAGTSFGFAPCSGPHWFRVTLDSGDVGWLHHSLIRFSFTADDLVREPAGDAGRRDLVLRAAGGDAEALHAVLEAGGGDSLEPDILNVLMHLVGDRGFARLLREKPLSRQLALRRLLIVCIDRGRLAPFDGPDYLRRRFPRVWALLFRKVVTDWHSPDGKFAIRKVFSEGFPSPDSGVDRAEVIDPRSGKVVFDFTAADTGRGECREGSVVWSSDSLAFTSIARDPARPGSRYVRTFRLADGAFRRVASREMPSPDSEPSGCDPNSPLTAE